jgi:hypothetical protein
MSTEVRPAVAPSKPKPAERRWAPRAWIGCDAFGWFRLLLRNRLAVGWPYWYIAFIDSLGSLVNTLLRWTQEAVYGRRVARTKIAQAPLFILGHWRTGTTLLHELLILDQRHTYPTTYECFVPNHFLLTERFVKRFFGFVMPNRRPMDNMAAGWDRPQEDEFALCNLGLPSPYLSIAFPNHPPQYPKYLDLEGIPAEALARWKRTFLWFLKHVTYNEPKRIVLKSPPHTCRIKVLLEMFPDACFVNIVRNPYTLFASTVNLWKSLNRAHGLQRPTDAGLEDYVLATFCRMHDRLEATRGLVAPERFYDLRYEELVKDPLSEMRALYEHLRLGGFEQVQPALESYLAGVGEYQTNRYELAPHWRAEVARRWRPYFERYGYPLEYRGD